MRDDTEFAGNFRDAEVNVKSTIVKAFAEASPSEIAAAELKAAAERLAEMPLDRVPTPAPLPVGSMMPLPANPLFVGREDDLVTLAKALALGGTAAIGQTAAATGLGGIGKTQLAAEFAHRYGPYFAGGVFWLGFADPDAIAGEVARAGSVAGMGLTDDFDSLPLDRQVQMVGATWQNPLPRLLIFDNCEDEALIAPWRPKTGGCRFLVTSRRMEWSPHLGIQLFPLGVLPRNESVELLLKHRNDLKSDDANLDAIAEELGDLPLALHMAGNFLRLYRHAPIGDPIKYLADLRSPHLLVHPSLITEGESPTEHTQHVSRTFQLSLQRLSKANDIDALALKALAHLACFAPGEPVPRFLLLGSLEKDDDDTAQIQATDALRRLVNLGLAESEGAGDLVLHRLLAAFVAATAEDFSEAREAVEVTVEVEADRLIDEGYPAPLQAWQGHLRAVTERAADVDSNHASDLLLVLGKFMREISAFDEAQAAFERALVIEEATCGADHPNAGTVINELGTVLSAKGDLDGATEAYERALAIHEASFGLFHPRVATGVNNLGRVLYDKGDLDGAKDAFERALVICEATYGVDHPTVATLFNNLGYVLHDKGEHDDAKAAFERALSVFESVLGLEHPSTQRVKNNLDNLTGQAREADTGRNTLSMTDNTTFSGDFRGAIVNYKSTLIDVRQSVKALPNTDDTDKAELDRLLAELTAALEAVPADKSDGAEAVAVQAKALVDEVCKEKPNKTMLGISSDGLKKAAETISDVAPNVLKVAGQIVEFFGKFGG